MARSPRRPTSSKGAKGAAPGMPDREAILEFIRNADGKVGKREIARAFDIRGEDRIELKRLLQEMGHDGTLSGNRRGLSETGRLPPTGVFDIVGRDRDGDLFCEPRDWEADAGPRPRALLREAPTGARRAPGETALGVGDRIQARTERLDGDGAYRWAVTPIKRLPKEKTRALGIFRTHRNGGGEILPVDKKEMRSWRVDPDRTGEAKDGDLVRFDLARGRHGNSEARVVEVLGNPDDQRQVSLIAVHAHGLPDEFPGHVLAELADLPALSMSGREDWRRQSFVTIDPVDARDHDDAVHAEPDIDAANTGGWIVSVAIADVAFYVRSGTRLDREARRRGNSIYFPDRVVPMLPERISNDLCSLRPGEDRPSLAVRMVFDRAGAKKRHTFHRVMIRSVAKLSYQAAQAAIEGRPDGVTAHLLDPVLKPLWAAYHVLAAARTERAPLDLDLPERKVILDEHGRVKDIQIPERLEAHRLIEEMMIQANVAAAETLEGKRARLVYRVHEPPSKEKLESLADFLATLDMGVPKAGALKPRDFNRILADVRERPYADLVSEVVLRSQSQAVYAAANAGHFGLNLHRYAHFTSPIRRYADLLVHRALVRALGLGPDGITDEEIGTLSAIAEDISQAERRAMVAERETIDRLIAHFLADKIGATFKARISGVTRSGVFVRLAGTGADGFIPISTLGADYFHHDEASHALVGECTHMAFRLGDEVQVKLAEVVPSAGAMRFEMLSPGRKLEGGAARRGRGIRGQRRLGGRQRGRR